MIATARMKFASEARPSQYIVPFSNTEPTCMPLSGLFMVIDGRLPAIAIYFQISRLFPDFPSSF